MLKKVLLGMGTAAVLGAVTAPMVWANPIAKPKPMAQQSLVALGDSISYGYNLNENVRTMINNHHMSKDAFPYLIGKAENMRVRDLGVPGWTSQQLLHALNSNAKFQQAVRHARVVTIDIGSNDLLGVLKNDGLNLTLLQKAGTNLVTHTLPAILAQVKKLNPSAKIVLYNIYNPFSAKADPFLNALGAQLLTPLNSGIYADAQNFGAYYADAFGAFYNHQSQYVLPGDVHPTAAGQWVLAKAGEMALDAGTS